MDSEGVCNGTFHSLLIPNRAHPLFSKNGDNVIYKCQVQLSRILLDRSNQRY